MQEERDYSSESQNEFERADDPTQRKRIAPELLIAGAAVVGMLVVGVIMFAKPGAKNVEPNPVAESATADVPSSPSDASGSEATEEPFEVTTAQNTKVLASPTTTETTISTSTNPTNPPVAVVPSTQPQALAEASTTTVDREQAAEARLFELIAQDAPKMPALEEQWVPQLSAKKLGTKWNGVVYDYQTILSEHESFRSQYGAILADGSTYSFKLDGVPMSGWFMSIVPTGYSTFDGALAWCTAHNIDSDNCFAKLITNRDDPGDTVKLNGE